MKIVIVGCGKVGSSLADVLSSEHNVTIIDKKEALVESASNDFDVMGIVGNCLQTEILEEANVSKADILIRLYRMDEARKELNAAIKRGIPRYALKEWLDKCK